MLRDLAARVLDVYAHIDAKVDQFAEKSGLTCPQGCGTCCISEKVEATPLEFLPLAFHLHTTHQAEFLIKRLQSNPDQKQCLLFRDDYVKKGAFGCSQYPYRALVCRLFGFCGILDKQGNICFSPCRVMKSQLTPAQHERLSPLLPHIPLFSTAGMTITTLDPSLGTHRIPINQALFEALTKVGLFLTYAAPDSHPVEAPLHEPPDVPPSPAKPPRQWAA